LGGSSSSVPPPPPHKEGEHRRKKAGGRGKNEPEDIPPPPWWEREVSSGICTDHYDVGKRLGKGAFSTVYEGTNRKSGVKYALKRVKLKDKHPGDKEKHLLEVLREVEFQKKIRHKNIISLEEFFVEPEQVVLVLEVMRGQTLLDSILDRGGYTEYDARVVFGAVLEVREGTRVVFRAVLEVSEGTDPTL